MLHISFPWLPPSPLLVAFVSRPVFRTCCRQLSQDSRQLPSLLMYAHVDWSWSFSWKIEVIWSLHGSQQSRGGNLVGKGAGIP